MSIIPKNMVVLLRSMSIMSIIPKCQVSNQNVNLNVNYPKKYGPIHNVPNISITLKNGVAYLHCTLLRGRKLTRIFKIRVDFVPR